jgi:hypothetical protein
MNSRHSFTISSRSLSIKYCSDKKLLLLISVFINLNNHNLKDLYLSLISLEIITIFYVPKDEQLHTLKRYYNTLLVFYFQLLP